MMKRKMALCPTASFAPSWTAHPAPSADVHTDRLAVGRAAALPPGPAAYIVLTA